MQLELPVRWTETDKSKTREEELIKGDYAEEKIKYTYGRLLIDSFDIGPYYEIDPNHTMINDKLGKIYCITIPLDQFKRILTEVTGKAIMSIQSKEQSPIDTVTPTRRKPRKDSGDDILM